MKYIFFFIFIFSATLFAKEPKITLFIPSSFIRDAIVTTLKKDGYSNVIAEDVKVDEITQYIYQERPNYVIVDASSLPPDEMLVYESLVVAASKNVHAEKVLLLAHQAVYPKKAAIPLREKTLETANIKLLFDPYALAKMTTYQKCHEFNDPQKPRFILCLYPELYGAKDPRLNTETRHPFYQAIQRVHKARENSDNFTVLNSDGKAYLDLLYIDDFAKSIIPLLQMPLDYDVYNIAAGRDVTMLELREALKGISCFTGDILLDPNAYDEVPRRLLSPGRIYLLGWQPTITLQTGLELIFQKK